MSCKFVAMQENAELMRSVFFGREKRIYALTGESLFETKARVVLLYNKRFTFLGSHPVLLSMLG